MSDRRKPLQPGDIDSALILDDAIGSADIDDALEAIFKARANHTGTQTLATISDAGALAAKNTVSDADINNVALAKVTGAGSLAAKSSVSDTDCDAAHKLLHPKMKVLFNGTGTVSIYSSIGVSGVTDNATGDFTINYSAAVASANIIWHGSAAGTSTAAGDVNSGKEGAVCAYPGEPSITTSLRIRTFEYGWEGYYSMIRDKDKVSVIIYEV